MDPMLNLKNFKPFQYGHLKMGSKKSKVQVYYLKAAKSLFVYFYGGKPHLGGLTAKLKLGDLDLSKTFSLPKHHDDVVTKKANRILTKKLSGVSFVGAGIHYDQLNKNQIRTILNNSEKLASKIKAQIQ